MTCIGILFLVIFLDSDKSGDIIVVPEGYSFSVDLTFNRNLFLAGNFEPVFSASSSILSLSPCIVWDSSSLFEMVGEITLPLCTLLTAAFMRLFCAEINAGSFSSSISGVFVLCWLSKVNRAPSLERPETERAGL